MKHQCRRHLFLSKALRCGLLMGIGFFSDEGFCAQIYALEGEKRISCVISQEHMNRIQIEGDRISAVYGADNAYVMETDEALGQVFLKAVNPAMESAAVYLSLVTEGDVTQDLKLIPSKVEAQTLIFKNQLVDYPQTEIHPPVGMALHLIKEMVASPALGKRPLLKERGEDRGVGADLKLTMEGQIKREGLKAQVFWVKNTGKLPLTLNPQMMAKALSLKPLALAFEEETLASGQATRLFIVAASDTGGNAKSHTKMSHLGVSHLEVSHGDAS